MYGSRQRYQTRVSITLSHHPLLDRRIYGLRACTFEPATEADAGRQAGRHTAEQSTGITIIARAPPEITLECEARKDENTEIMIKKRSYLESAR